MPRIVIPQVVLVGGAPATGKTTLAERLAANLGYPLLNKDLIKESLFDSLGSPDRERSKQLSLAAYGVLYLIARRLIEAGTSHILESNFQRGVSEKNLLPPCAKLAGRPDSLRRLNQSACPALPPARHRWPASPRPS